MSAATARQHEVVTATPPQAVTLLELISVLYEFTDDDREVVATALHMLESGSISLRGNFRGTPIHEFF